MMKKKKSNEKGRSSPRLLQLGQVSGLSWVPDASDEQKQNPRTLTDMNRGDGTQTNIFKYEFGDAELRYPTRAEGNNIGAERVSPHAWFPVAKRSLDERKH